jgi:hypothetical protein
MKRNLLLQGIKSFLNISVFILFLLSGFFTQVFGQKTWDGGAGTLSWTDANNWNPNVVPGATDVVVFNAQTLAIINVPNVSISKLQITNNSNITLRPQTSNNRTLTVTSATNDAILVEAGSTLLITGIDAAIDRTLTLTTANTVGLQANINGTIIVGIHNNQVNAAGNFTKGGTNATILINAGATYQHDRNAGAIPTATWNANSNCNITGVTSTIPTATTFNQSFGNFTWNCTGQTSNLSFTGNLRTINGNFTVSSTGGTGTAELRLSSGTIQTLTVGGNFTLSSGTLNFNSGAGTFTMNVAGNFTHSGGIITETSTDAGSIVFNGTYNGTTGMQTYTSGGTVSNTINFTVNSGAYLQMAAAGTTVTGGGTFTLLNGGTLGITSAEGITTSACGTGVTCGNIRTTNRNFNTGANYIYNGTSAQNTGNGLPATVGNLIIDNSAEQVTFNSARTITNNFTITAGSVANLGTFTHSAGDLTLGVEGTVAGSWGSSSSTAVNKNDTYFAATTGIVNVTNSKCGVVAAPSGITATPSEICRGSSTVLSVTNPGEGLTTDWFTGSCGGTLVGTGNSLSVNPSSTTTYYARTKNTTTGCVSSTCASVTVTVDVPVPAFSALVTNSTCPTSSEGAVAISDIPTALTFANADFDYINAGSSFLSGLGRFTLEGWIKVDKSTIGNRIGLFGQNDAVEFGFSNNTTIQCWSAGGGSVNVPLTAYPDDNGWHHIAAVGNGTNIIVYIDGVQVGIGGSSTSNYGSSADFVRIGAAVYDPVTTTTGGFTGQMLKVGFWNTALAPAQIGSLASGFTEYTESEPGLIAGYNFYEGAGTSLASATSTGNGSFVNSPVWSEIFTYSWTKTGDAGFSASTKNISALTTGEYNLTVANGSCNRAESFTVGSVSNKPSIEAIATPADLCDEETLNPSTPTITDNGSTVTAQGWQLETVMGGGTFVNITVPFNLTFADNGKKLRYYATNGCGTTNSNEVTVTVNPLPGTGEIIPD